MRPIRLRLLDATMTTPCEARLSLGVLLGRRLFWPPRAIHHRVPRWITRPQARRNELRLRDGSADGATLRDFRKDFKAIVARHGWEFTGSRGSQTRRIFETNIRASYPDGRWAQVQAVRRRRPLLLYKHADFVTHR